jgi:exodeoxyribonuclease III
VWRHFNPSKRDAYTYWDNFTKARDRNVGWRIDYFFASRDLLPKVKKVEILNSVYGSDHCPISIDLDI